MKKNFLKSKIFFKKNQYPKQLIETKINKCLEGYKVDNITFKQNQTTESKTKSNQENDNYS